MAQAKSLSDKADKLEFQQMQALGELMIYRSQINKLADGEWTDKGGFSLGTAKPSLMGEDPRLPKMPAAPILIEFFKDRFAPSRQHLLQGARLAQKNGLPEKMVLACLLHDISVIAFFRPDHGYWGAQMLEPYVDEEVSWAIRYHQALRFFPDESVGYEYPEAYAKRFGDDYKVEFNRIELTDVAAKTRHLPEEWIVNGNDISDKFVKYALPIVGDLPVVERIED